MSLTSYRAALPRNLFLVKRRMKVSDFWRVARGIVSFFIIFFDRPVNWANHEEMLTLRKGLGSFSFLIFTEN